MNMEKVNNLMEQIKGLRPDLSNNVIEVIAQKLEEQDVNEVTSVNSFNDLEKVFKVFPNLKNPDIEIIDNFVIGDLIIPVMYLHKKTMNKLEEYLKESYVKVKEIYPTLSMEEMVLSGVFKSVYSYEQYLIDNYIVDGYSVETVICGAVFNFNEHLNEIIKLRMKNTEAMNNLIQEKSLLSPLLKYGMVPFSNSLTADPKKTLIEKIKAFELGLSDNEIITIVNGLLSNDTYNINNVKDISDIPFNTKLYIDERGDKDVSRILLVDNKIVFLFKKNVDNKVLYAEYMEALRIYAQQHDIEFNIFNKYSTYHMTQVYPYETYLADNFILSGTEESTHYYQKVVYLGEYNKYLSSHLQAIQEENIKIADNYILFSELIEF